MSDEVRKQLKAHGVSEADCEKALAVKTKAEARGLPWRVVVSLLVQYGPQALEIIQKVLDALNKPQTQTAPPS